MTKEQWLIIGAFACTYFIWGSTYLANYWAIDTIPVFGMGAMRFLVAGVILYAMSFFIGPAGRPSLKQWANASFIGLLFLSIGVGAVVWAQQWVPTSTTALIISFEPLIVMLMMWGLFSNRPPMMAFVGAGVSIFGMYLLIDQPATLSGEGSVKGLLAILLAMSCWGVGMILSPKLDMGKNKFRSNAMQMLTGGGVLLLFSFMIREWAGWSPDQVTPKSFYAWLYLVVFGAILGFSAFNFLLSKVSAEKVSTNTYVNPIVAVLLGGLLNNEIVTGRTMIAGAILLAGVWFINSTKKSGSQEVT
ncbi:EamA family transporter [Neolewinella agarilytica]|uniref:Permease of the drug/metabolite transporter (DMT) superfamily n=1 Tax=Neolewinella agarilytica TaxID=478744 RepID=A0A1H9NIR5_9BACT|nr:EamA family transporter [Neolewinella agarilytica]SER35791.1 Permease of the drug/metabolite transporter (DMT) superfamily [Neolewinella agarilytica]